MWGERNLTRKCERQFTTGIPEMDDTVRYLPMEKDLAEYIKRQAEREIQMLQEKQEKNRKIKIVSQEDERNQNLAEKEVLREKGSVK